MNPIALGVVLTIGIEFGLLGVFVFVAAVCKAAKEGDLPELPKDENKKEKGDK